MCVRRLDTVAAADAQGLCARSFPGQATIPGAQLRSACAKLGAEARADSISEEDEAGWAIWHSVNLKGPSGAHNLFASRSVRRALLTPRLNPGSLYRCGKST